ncbi:MAG: endonuclease/exonuclease/phosphatase family protein, partial [Pseudomonadota bacterium]
MSEEFTKAEWKRINAALDADPERYGLPERRSRSVVLASFNIRKLGNPEKKTNGAFDFLARFCAQCDLIAVQEVLEDMSALERLRGETSAKAGAEFRILVSDITGGRDGATGSTVERLAFLYREGRVVPTGIASDISFDRSYIYKTLWDNRKELLGTFKSYEKARTKAEADGKRKPVFVSPHFVDFIRTPHIASFEIPTGRTKEPYRFSAVNAHLLFGDASKQAEERRREFDALCDWLLIRAAKRKSYNQDFILMGDLNLDFDDPSTDRGSIVDGLKEMNAKLKKKKAATVVNFPFLDDRKSPRTGEMETIRTNARMNQTFDQIGIFAHDDRLPSWEDNPIVSGNRRKDDYDYQVFDFTNLFAEVIRKKPIPDLKKLSKAERKEWSKFIDRFQHDVSDHMPIWVRLRRT